MTPETPEETTIGPMTLGLISFNEDGSGNIQNVPVSVLEEALGTSIPLKIDPSLMATLSQLGAETLSVATQANGVDLAMNDQPLARHRLRHIPPQCTSEVQRRFGYRSGDPWRPLTKSCRYCRAPK